MDKNITSALERMDQILKPHRAWQEQIDKLLEPQRKLQEQMEKYLEPQRRIQEQMNNYLEPHRKLQEQMERYLEPQRRLQEQMDKYLEPQRKLQEQMQKYLEPQRLLQDQISKYLSPLNEYLSSPSMGNVVVESSGAISVSGEIIDTEAVNESIESLSNDYSSTEEFLEQFFKLLEKLSNGARIVVIYLVFPYLLAIIANLTTPVYEEWWKEYTDFDQRTAKKQIIREANELYSTEELNEYRFVYASILHVRKSGSMNSEIIDELYLGKSIKIHEKLKRWSFIEFQDSETGNIKKGWVFSRYLHKFIK